MTSGNLITEGIIYLTAVRRPHPDSACGKNVQNHLRLLIKSYDCLAGSVNESKALNENFLMKHK